MIPPLKFLQEARHEKKLRPNLPGTEISAAPIQLRCEHRINPLGIDEMKPRLAWQMSDTRRGAAQQGYQVLVASSLEQLNEQEADRWNSGKVDSSESVEIDYAGKPLISGQLCGWQVRLWDHEGVVSPWSEPAFWEMGLLNAQAWEPAQWVSLPPRDSECSQPCPFLRRDFSLTGNVTKARLYVTARGLFTLELNGHRVGNDELAPGWTDYHQRLMYLTYDVTDLLHADRNAIGAVLGDGWHCGYLLWTHDRVRNHYGKQTSLLMQMVVDYADGTRQTISTDEHWHTTTGPILASDIYNGETYDARLEMPGWSEPNFEVSHWEKAQIAPPTSALLVAKRNETIQPIEEMTPSAITEPAKGTYVFDLGQNMVGRARLKIEGAAGTQIMLRFAEMLNEDGTIYIENLRYAEATDRYTLRGDGVETYEPRFTYHGFRYVELTGCTEPPTLDTITGIVMHSNMPATGNFECSDPKINRLAKNILWGQKGNFLDIPTDCPQRDERLGWTGDAQVFIRTAAFNMNVSAFFEKWAFDMADAQNEDGAFPYVVPDLLKMYGSAGWSDAGVICPWMIYLCYGQKRILQQNYHAMSKWIAYQQQTSPNFIRTSEGHGDWLAIDAVAADRAPTPTDLIGTAYFAYTTQLMARIARILGKEQDAKLFEILADQIKAAFNREFVSPGGRVVGHTQTGYLIALAFGLLPQATRPIAVEHLVDLIEQRDWHLTTGFLGTPLLLPVLTRFGRTDVAYRLLKQETYPSWLYSCEQGATTMWERWNSYTKADGFGDVNMNSFNHYAFGAVGEWLYATIGGIDLDIDQPGYKHTIIRPDPGTAEHGLTWAKADLMTPYGSLRSHWHIENDQLTLEVTVPPNSTATIHLPATSSNTVRESGNTLETSKGIGKVTTTPQGLQCHVVAGTYLFNVVDVEAYQLVTASCSIRRN